MPNRAVASESSGGSFRQERRGATGRPRSDSRSSHDGRGGHLGGLVQRPWSTFFETCPHPTNRHPHCLERAGQPQRIPAFGERRIRMPRMWSRNADSVAPLTARRRPRRLVCGSNDPSDRHCRTSLPTTLGLTPNWLANTSYDPPPSRYSETTHSRRSIERVADIVPSLG